MDNGDVDFVNMMMLLIVLEIILKIVIMMMTMIMTVLTKNIVMMMRSIGHASLVR